MSDLLDNPNTTVEIKITYSNGGIVKISGTAPHIKRILKALADAKEQD